MKVLWFEVSVPSSYVSGGKPIAGWQDSLERIVKRIPEMELVIAFMSNQYSEVKTIDGVTYVPIFAKWSFFERRFFNYWDVYLKKVMPSAISIVRRYNPNLIQVFGTEWPYGQIRAYTNIPVVIHLMGAIIPYNNASYPPGYSYKGLLSLYWYNPRRLYNIWMNELNRKKLELLERKTWKLVDNYMGRTQWDCSLSRVMHANRNYFHVDEALRVEFLVSTQMWHFPKENKIRLVSTGCSTFWKGPDMMLKVACILTNLGIDFEWYVAGDMDKWIKDIVEKKEGIRFEDCNISIMGFLQPKELIHLLCTSTIYVHTAYIENSPNSICEAQYLGVPIVSTNVGGISTLVRNGVDGILVPANDPWRMTDAIIQLANDRPLMRTMSDSSQKVARQRHSDITIMEQVLSAYNTIISRK